MPLREIAFVFSSTWLCFIRTLYQSGVLVVTHSLLKIGFPGPWVWVFLLHQVFSLFSTTALLMLFFTQQSLYSKLFFQECFSTMSLLKSVLPRVYSNNLSTQDCFPNIVSQQSYSRLFFQECFSNISTWVFFQECFSTISTWEWMFFQECFSTISTWEWMFFQECFLMIYTWEWMFFKRFFQQSVLKNVVPRVFFSNLYSGMFFPNSVFAIMWHACHFRWRSVSKD